MPSQQFYDAEIRRLILRPGTADAPLNVITQSASPTNATQGDIYWDSDDLTMRMYDGTGWQIPGSRRIVKTGAATLTDADSTALCVWNSSTGFLYTLPTAVAGLWFDFVVTTTAGSGSHKVITASASEFLLGSFLQIPDAAAQIVARAADGSTIRAWAGNGTTTGGIAGDSFRLTAISATQWVISNGIGLATGTEATPFATS